MQVRDMLTDILPINMGIAAGGTGGTLDRRRGTPAAVNLSMAMPATTPIRSVGPSSTQVRP